MRSKTVWFNHGWGDVCQFIAILKLYEKYCYKISCHCKKNKEPVFLAAGCHESSYGSNSEYIEQGGDINTYHSWLYPPGFNRLELDEIAMNKAAFNVNLPPLPILDVPKEKLWQELCDMDLSGIMEN
jgi:hypothetical protein